MENPVRDPSQVRTRYDWTATARSHAQDLLRAGQPEATVGDATVESPRIPFALMRKTTKPFSGLW